MAGFVREIALDADLMMPDGLHPTAEGHRKLAETLATAIEELLPGDVSTAWLNGWPERYRV